MRLAILDGVKLGTFSVISPLMSSRIRFALAGWLAIARKSLTVNLCALSCIAIDPPHL
jgi:hypothetical protein